MKNVRTYLPHLIQGHLGLVLGQRQQFRMLIPVYSSEDITANCVAVVLRWFRL